MGRKTGRTCGLNVHLDGTAQVPSHARTSDSTSIIYRRQDSRQIEKGPALQSLHGLNVYKFGAFPPIRSGCPASPETSSPKTQPGDPRNRNFQAPPTGLFLTLTTWPPPAHTHLSDFAVSAEPIPDALSTSQTSHNNLS